MTVLLKNKDGKIVNPSELAKEFNFEKIEFTENKIKSDLNIYGDTFAKFYFKNRDDSEIFRKAIEKDFFCVYYDLFVNTTNSYILPFNYHIVQLSTFLIKIIDEELIKNKIIIN